MDIPRVKNLMITELDQDSQLLSGAGIAVIRTGGAYVPFLGSEETLGMFPSVTVDMGAVKFVCKGADIMRPGITSYTEFSRGDIICVVEESRKKFLAVGRAMAGSAEMKGMKKGQIVKNIHYVSDRFWEAGRS